LTSDVAKMKPNTVILGAEIVALETTCRRKYCLEN